MCETCGCDNHDHHHTHLLLAIKGLESAEAAAKIEAKLNQLIGVHATVDFALQAISLLLHEDGDLAAVKKMLADAGYQA